MIDVVAPDRPMVVPMEAVLRRGLDLAIAAAALVATAPLMLAVAVAIWCESPGPLLFRQQRLGRGGRPFTMVKFRKFHAAAVGGALTLGRDPRMTRVGRFLMASKLDELPQLWNVLRGDMAMIGPRPESLAFADCFRGGFEAVLDHKPGLLGPCQILFRNESALFVAAGDADAFYRDILFPAKAGVDLAYARRRTIRSDLSLMAAGVWVVCGGGGEPAIALKRLLETPADSGDPWVSHPFAGLVPPIGADPPAA